MNDLIVDNPGRRRMLLDAPFQENENALTPFRHTLGAVWSNRWLASITAVVVFALVIGAGLILNRTHYAEALLEVQPAHANFGQANQQNAEPAPPDTNTVDTEVEILRSPAVAQAVVTKLKLTDDPEFGAPAKPDLLHRALGALVGTPAPQPVSQSDVMPRAVAAVRSNSRIRRIGLTYMVQVGFVASTTQKAETIANMIVAAYLQVKLDRKFEAVKRANDDLGVTLAGLRDQALGAQSKLEAYETQNGLLAANRVTLAEGELASLNEKLADAQADSAEKLAAMAAAQQQQQSGAADNTLGVLRQREAETSATLAQLQTQFGPEYPAVKKVQAELQDIRDEVQSESGRVLAALNAQARAAEKKEAAILASRNAVEQTIQTNNQARVGLLPLQQAADSARTIYETYLQRASEVTAQRGLQQVDASLESKAVPGMDSIFSSLSVIALVGAVLALLCSVVVVMLREMWTPRIKSLADVRRETGMPVVGLLPDAAPSTRGNAPAAYVTDNPLTIVAEAFRSLGAFLAMSPQRGMEKIITVTSAVPGEGKTLTSICLAKTLAAQGTRVLLVDCDLRHPSTPTFFARPQYSLSDVIQAGIPSERAMTQDVKSGIWFLAGARDRDIPTFLFSDHRLDALLANLSEQFDHIIIDTPPVLGFADARIMAAKAGRVLLLIRWNKTPASVARAAMEVLRLCNARVTGVVLNRVDVQQQAVYGFADGSDYYHHYGSAYKLT